MPAALAVAALSASLAGCGLGNGLYNVDLPGGADLGSHPYSITADFADAQDLVPQAGVQVNDVAVGRISAIKLNRAGNTAEVTVQINGSVHLPANAVASIQQTSLLGEKYVALSAPLDAPATGHLQGGAVIPKTRTSNGVQVEQVLGALSMLLNGGGIGQLHTIEHELNRFMGGNTQQIRTFLSSTSRFVGVLARHRQSINHALDALATLAGTLDKQNGHIRTVLRSLAPGISVIASQHKQLIRALAALNHLSTVTVRTIRLSKSNTVADLKALAPILRELASADSDLPDSLQELLTFPFSNGATHAIKGDYLNTYATLMLRTKGGKVYPSVPVSRRDVTRDTQHGTSHTTPTHTTSTHTTSTHSTSAHTTSTTTPTDSSAGAAPPSGLLPATSAAASGLPGTLTVASTTTTAGR